MDNRIIKNGFHRHTGHFYTVENQNGFNNALYDFYSATDDGVNASYSKKDIRKMVQNYPDLYPRSIIIIDQTYECSRIFIEQFSLSEEAHIGVTRGFMYRNEVLS